VSLARDRRRGGVKIIDVTGVVTFGALAAAGLAGGPPTAAWIADYGRGSATALLAVIMLASAVKPTQADAARQPACPAQQRRSEHRPVPVATPLTSSGDRSGSISASNGITGG
jgi:hypothetical protein